MAPVASCRQRCVVVIGMAGCAGNRDMRTSQRKSRVVVIEGRGSPGRGVMARGACGRKAGSDMIGVRCPRVIGLVARVAVGRHRCVVVIGMALRAGDCDVRSGQRERRSRVIESSPGPVRRRVASGACGGEASRRMRRSISSGVVRLVAGIAVSGHRCVVVIGVTRRARNRHMRARQRERCSRVIEGCPGPVRRRVASGACGWETCRRVRRSIGSGVIRLVAGIAIGWHRGVVVICVAGRASHRGMGAGQREDRRVIEARRRPVRGCVAKAAIGGEAAGNVIGIRGPSEIRLMAGITCRRR